MLFSPYTNGMASSLYTPTQALKKPIPVFLIQAYLRTIKYIFEKGLYNLEKFKFPHQSIFVHTVPRA